MHIRLLFSFVFLSDKFKLSCLYIIIYSLTILYSSDQNNLFLQTFEYANQKKIPLQSEWLKRLHFTGIFSCIQYQCTLTVNQISLSSGYSRSASLLALDSVKYHTHQLGHQYPALDHPTAGSCPSVPGIYLQLYMHWQTSESQAAAVHQ